MMTSPPPADALALLKQMFTFRFRNNTLELLWIIWITFNLKTLCKLKKMKEGWMKRFIIECKLHNISFS